MKKLLLLILTVFFIASLPLFVQAGMGVEKKGFNQYTEDPTPALRENNWKNEYYPLHHRKMMENRYGYAMRNQNQVKTYYYRHNYYNHRMNRYFLRCY